MYRHVLGHMQGHPDRKLFFSGAIHTGSFVHKKLYSPDQPHQPYDGIEFCQSLFFQNPYFLATFSRVKGIQY